MLLQPFMLCSKNRKKVQLNVFTQLNEKKII